MLAAADGRLAIIQYLLKSGADLDITDYRKQSAADWAEERGNNEVISYFTKYAQDQRTLLFCCCCLLFLVYIVTYFSRGNADKDRD